jgi:hypothetical protein
MTVKAKRGSDAQNVFNVRTKSVAREGTKHLNTFVCLVLKVKQGFLPKPSGI